MKCSICSNIYQNDNEGDINLCNTCMRIMEKYNKEWLKELTIKIKILTEEGRE